MSDPDPDPDVRTDDVAVPGPCEVQRSLPTFGGAAVAVHDHLCAFYRGHQERDRLVGEHMREGLRAGDTCLYVAAEGEQGRSRRHVGFGHPEIDLGRLDVVVPSSTYLKDGRFVQGEMLELLDDWSQATFDTGECAFARVAADMSWALPYLDRGFVGALFDFESRVMTWTNSYPQIGVCMYDLDEFGGDMIVAMIQSHPKIWISGLIVENPYFARPSGCPMVAPEPVGGG
jgi:hypothetical protein